MTCNLAVNGSGRALVARKTQCGEGERFANDWSS